MFKYIMLFSLLAIPVLARADDGVWPKQSRALLEQSQGQTQGHDPRQYSPGYLPTTDGRSFVIAWQPDKDPPKKWLVSLPGTHGYVMNDFMVWMKSLQGRHDIGFIGIQWWMGQGDKTGDYYTPEEIYREIDNAFTKIGVVPGTAMLEGFSRGSSNIYAVAALDQVKGKKYFSVYVANSGGASMDYPPTKKITDGAFGKTPFAGTNWVTSCGDKDPHPDRDGCPAMRRTGEWLESLGATVAVRIEDPDAGHGALNLHHQNAEKLLNWYTGDNLP